MAEQATVRCQKCRLKLACHSTNLRLELTCDDEPVVYCSECWEREFGEE